MILLASGESVVWVSWIEQPRNVLGQSTWLKWCVSGFLRPSSYCPGQVIHGKQTATREDDGQETSRSGLDRGPIQVKLGESIQRRIDEAHAGDVVLLEPGQYDECLRIAKKVHLKAQDGNAIVRSSSPNLPALHVPDSGIGGSICHVTFSPKDHAMPPAGCPAVLLEGGPEGGAQAQASPAGDLILLKHCRVEGGGMHVGARGSAVVEDTHITAAVGCGVEVHDRARVLLVRCRVHSCAHAGVRLRGTGEATLEHCNVYENGAVTGEMWAKSGGIFGEETSSLSVIGSTVSCCNAGCAGVGALVADGLDGLEVTAKRRELDALMASDPAAKWQPVLREYLQLLKAYLGAVREHIKPLEALVEEGALMLAVAEGGDDDPPSRSKRAKVAVGVHTRAYCTRVKAELAWSAEVEARKHLLGDQRLHLSWLKQEDEQCTAELVELQGRQVMEDKAAVMAADLHAAEAQETALLQQIASLKQELLDNHGTQRGLREALWLQSHVFRAQSVMPAKVAEQLWVARSVLGDYEDYMVQEAGANMVLFARLKGDPGRCVLRALKWSHTEQVGILTHLHHPLVLPVEAVFFDVERRQCFLQTPYAEQTLEQWADSVAAQPYAWHSVARQLLQVLAHVHAQGVRPSSRQARCSPS
ncbi:hypothetical protein CYMTET_55699 [Cymbomonas tetramitiformis]|uniref:Right handed beta helix domain-containing protein n=1 Tax=Cymbomonas tetramitiformis TaxID=36881 RepID=A0AAE0EN39_9CHLO|nr:hypothetical protein CYMTET_55699 [Cymbomonas tetramitiformis]